MEIKKKEKKITLEKLPYKNRIINTSAWGIEHSHIKVYVVGTQFTMN